MNNSKWWWLLVINMMFLAISYMLPHIAVAAHLYALVIGSTVGYFMKPQFDE